MAVSANASTSTSTLHSLTSGLHHISIVYTGTGSATRKYMEDTARQHTLLLPVCRVALIQLNQLKKTSCGYTELQLILRDTPKAYQF